MESREIMICTLLGCEIDKKHVYKVTIPNKDGNTSHIMKYTGKNRIEKDIEGNMYVICEFVILIAHPNSLWEVGEKLFISSNAMPGVVMEIL